MTETNRFKDTLKEHLDIDFTSSDDPIATIAEKLKSFKTSTVNTADYVPKSEFSKVKQQLADLVTREEQAQTKLRNVRITEALDQVMGDSFHGKDFVIKNLIASGEVRVDSDGGIVFVDGDDEMDLQKGVEKLKKTRPDMVKNISKPGAESSRRENRQDDKLISLGDFNKLPAKEKALKMSEGYKLTQ
jgi:ATP-dependent protease HslVU (ClpYQ) ATPase subunit